MSLLLHICCAPCAIYTIEALRKEEIEFSGYWFNPNIHPFLEYNKRFSEVRRLANEFDFPLIENDKFDLEDFLSKVMNLPANISRCAVCYETRLRETASFAESHGFSHFSTTLLYSRYQKHDEIRSIGECVAKECGAEFFYRDFRVGWSRGLKLSRKHNIYRQQY